MTAARAQRQRRQTRPSLARRNVGSNTKEPDLHAHWMMSFFSSIIPLVCFTVGVWNEPQGPELLLSKGKPKECCQREEEEDDGEGGRRPNECERDVYTFTGDSDPESPPPAPWAHCTFYQRCRKKRVLLRPFAGLGTLTHTLPDTGRRGTPQESITAEQAQLSGGGGVYDVEDVHFGEGAHGDPGDGGRKGDQEDEGGSEPGKHIFTCVECSIYFKKQVYLQEHMVEHCQNGAGGDRRSGEGGRFQCTECGWNLPNGPALASHSKRHQESRLKILGEIEKLNENGKEKEIQKPDSQAMMLISQDPSVAQESSPVPVPGSVSRNSHGDPEVTFPPPSPEPVPTSDGDPATLESGATQTPPDSAQKPPQPRAVPAYRRRFVCPKCNFSTRTSQALANHTKTHNRKRTRQAGSAPPDSPSGLASASLACGHCAFVTSSQTVLREHQTLVHPDQASVRGADGTDVLPDSAQGKTHQGIAGSDDGTTPDVAAAHPASRVMVKSVRKRRFNRRRKAWTDLTKTHPRLNADRPPGSEAEQEESTDLHRELSRRDTDSPVGVNQPTGGRTDAGETGGRPA